MAHPRVGGEGMAAKKWGDGLALNLVDETASTKPFQPQFYALLQTPQSASVCCPKAAIR